MLNISSCVYYSSICLLWRNVFSGCFVHFFIIIIFFLVLSFLSCLCIMEVNPFLVVSFAIISPHSEGCLFTLFIASFCF